MLRILRVSLLMYSCWAETLETDTENLATDTPDADRNDAVVWANAADTTDRVAAELLLEESMAMGNKRPATLQ